MHSGSEGGMYVFPLSLSLIHSIYVYVYEYLQFICLLLYVYKQRNVNTSSASTLDPYPFTSLCFYTSGHMTHPVLMGFPSECVRLNFVLTKTTLRFLPNLFDLLSFNMSVSDLVALNI